MTAVASFPRAEVEAAFRQYFHVGPVMEDWIAWSQLFTDDAVYLDHYYGRFRGPKEIELFLESTMMAGRHCYTSLVWFNIDGHRVVWQGLNTADHPDPTQPPFTFPSLQVVEYAGDGKWSSEADWWIKSEMVAFAKGYADACRAAGDTVDPMSRGHWGDIEWARPPKGHVARPSWWGREHEVPAVRRIEEMQFGERV